MRKKDITILSIILASPIIIGVIVAWCFNFQLERGDWITLITSCLSTFIAIFLGYMIFFQTESHKQSDYEDRKQDLLIRATPNLSFSMIEYASVDFNAIIALSESSSTCLKYWGSVDEDDKQLPLAEFLDKYSIGVLFGFIFICNQDKGLMNVLFKRVSVYPDYPINTRNRIEKEYVFVNKATKIEDKGDYQTSYIGNDKYQIFKYFMFPTDESDNSIIAKNFINDITIPNSSIFFNILYEAINIYGVKIEGELKFIISAKRRSGDRIFFEQPYNISNWLSTPDIVEIKDNKVKE